VPQLTQGTSSGYQPQLGQILFGIEPEFVSIESTVVVVGEFFVVATLAAGVAAAAGAAVPARETTLRAPRFFVIVRHELS